MYRHAFALICASALLLASAGSARAGEGLLGDDGILGNLYTSWELLYIERDKTPDVEVGYMFQPGHPRFREILTTDDVVDDDQQFGGRAVLGLRLNDTQAVELVYMGWGHDREASARSPLERLFAFEAPDAVLLNDDSFDSAAVFDLEYDEDFYNAELNFRQHLEVDGADYSFDLIAGIRAIRLEEDLHFISLDEFPLFFGGLGTYNIDTRNTLIGGQLGVEAFVPLWEDRLDLDLYLVGGGYANNTKILVGYANGVMGNPMFVPLVIARESRDTWDPAGVFDFAATFGIHVVPGVTLELGYRALVLLNIASAPDQFARSGAAGDLIANVDNDDSTVFHGPSLGLTIEF